MGYYISYSTNTGFLLPREHYDAAFAAACQLNDHDELKRGGSWGGELNANHRRPEGLDHHPARHFSWMPNDYPAVCDDLIELLERLGFTVTEDERGITGLQYDDKAGQEEVFLWAIAPFIAPGSAIQHQGEDDFDICRYLFDGSTMKIVGGYKTIVWESTPRPFEPCVYPFKEDSK